MTADERTDRRNRLRAEREHSRWTEVAHHKLRSAPDLQLTLECQLSASQQVPEWRLSRCDQCAWRAYREYFVVVPLRLQTLKAMLSRMVRSEPLHSFLFSPATNLGKWLAAWILQALLVWLEKTQEKVGSRG